MTQNEILFGYLNDSYCSKLVYANTYNYNRYNVYQMSTKASNFCKF